MTSPASPTHAESLPTAATSTESGGPSTAAEFEQRIRTQIHRSISIAHAATFVTGVISVAGSAQLRRRPRAWAALAVSAVQGVSARRAMVRGDFSSPRVAGLHAVGAALNQELMPDIPGGASKRERRWVRDQSVWLSAMSGAGGSTRPGFWTAVAHVPLVVRAARGEAEAASHVAGQGLWLAFLWTALHDALRRAPAVLAALDERTATASVSAEQQAAHDALVRSVTPLLVRMESLRDNVAVLSAGDRAAQCRAMLTEANEVCDQAATTMGNELRDQDLFEEMVAELQKRSDRTNTYSYWAVIVGSLTNVIFDFHRGDVPRGRVLASAGVTAGLTWHSLQHPTRFMQGELVPGTMKAAILQGLGGGASALVLTGAPAGSASFGNYDLMALTSAGVGSDSRSVVVPWAISSVIGLPTLLKVQLPTERVFLIAGTLGMAIGLPLALNNFLRGVCITNAAAAASRERLVADAREQGTRRALRWAQLAAHDYVKQTARFLLNHPEAPREQFEEVLGDAIRQLEAGIGSSFQQAPQRSEIGELVAELAGAYRRLELEPEVVLDLSGPVSAEVERAVLTAVNQGLANVLAHTDDSAPVVLVRTSDGGASVEVTNERRGTVRSPERLPPERAPAQSPTLAPAKGPTLPPAQGLTPDGTGFRLLDAALSPVDGERTLRIDHATTVLQVRVPPSPHGHPT